LSINGTIQTMKAILSTLKYLLIAIGSTLSVAVLVWLAIFLFAQTISIDKAFALIFYPSIVAGVIAPLAWWLRGRKLEA
jgi:flagellar biosynthesis protein FliQ